jgi:hypothetical protein
MDETISFTWDSVDSIAFRFSDRTLHAQCSDSFEIGAILKNHKLLKIDPIDVIRELIYDLIESSCVNTTVLSRIRVIARNLPLTWASLTGTNTKLTSTAKLVRTLNNIAAIDDQDLIIDVNCTALYFHPDFNGTNWDHVSEEPFVSSTPPPDYLPDPVHDFKTRFTMTSPAPTFPSHGNGPSSQVVDVFDLNNAPSDVQIRYNDYHDSTKIIPVSSLVPFHLPGGDKNFYADVKTIGNRCILLNGQTLQYTLDYKKLAKDPPICSGTTPADIRRWYIEMESHANNCGYYIPPYELQNQTNGPDGFIFDQDIPDILRPNKSTWANDLGRLLRRSGVFPARTTLASRVQSTTNGYHALRAIINQSHPLFVDKPALMAPDLPYQAKGQSLIEFYKQYTDNIFVNAIFLGTSQDLRSKHAIDSFIGRCIDSAYLFQASQFDRQDPSKQHLFNPGSLPLTLESYLQDPSNPSRLTPSSDSKPLPFKSRFGEGRKNGDTPYTPFKSRFDSHKSGDGASTPYRSQTIRQLFGETHELDGHDSDAELAELADFAVCQLARLPDDSTSCGICGQTHAFGECPALSNTRYMRHYVSATQRHHKKMHSDLKRYADAGADKNIRELKTESPPLQAPPDFQQGEEK